MSVNQEKVEWFAELFHRYYRALAPDFGCRFDHQSEWRELTLNERRRLVAAARLALAEAESGSSCHERRFHSLPAEGTEGRECGC